MKTIGMAALALFVALGLGCGAAAPVERGGIAAETSHPGAQAPASLTVVAISDFHGALEPYLIETADGHTVEMGGAAMLSAYIQRIREQSAGPVVILDGGDMFQGTMVSNLQQGAPVIRFYNHIGLAAAAVGNHEFDFGPSAPERTVAVEPDDDPLGALRERVAEANFPFLAANMFDTRGEVPEWAAASIVIERDGLRIGIIGAATVDTPSTTIAANVADLVFEEAGPHVAAEVERLTREESVDVVLFTGHIGSGCRSFEDRDDLSVCRDGELLRTLRAVPEGRIAAAVGGHTHQGVAHRMGRTALLQPFAQGRYIAWAEVFLDGETPPQIHGPTALCATVIDDASGNPTCDGRRVPSLEGVPRPATFLGATIAPDPEVVALLADDIAAVRTLHQRPLGIEVAETIPRSYREESALGNLVADLMRAGRGTDLAATNGGGIRAELPEGPLTYGRLFEVLPFDNRYVDMEISGETVATLVRHGVTSGRSALLWSGLTFREEGCEVVEIRVGDAPLDPGATYTLTLNDYLAGGGSGFADLDLPPAEIDWNGPMVRDHLATLIGELEGPLRPAHFFDPEAPRQMRSGADCAP